QVMPELEAARAFAAQAGSKVAEAEALGAAAKAKCDEVEARGKELQSTLGLQAHQLVQAQRGRDEAEAKFQKAMEQLISAQTTHKKQMVEYEQKLQQQGAMVTQYNELRDRFRQARQLASNAEQRTLRAEAKVQERDAVVAQRDAALVQAANEKAELMRMCNELLTQLELSKAKAAR
ncbi:hypothetical protein TSOC_005591, partial [Tetrabaena socialis]